jgi:hypothetical protein
MLNKKEAIVQGIFEDLINSKTGCFVTLNTIKSTRLSIEPLLAELSDRLNNYCYPEEDFRQGNSTRLRIVVAVENGNINGGVHAHALIMQKYQKSFKTYEDIELFIRKNWYGLLEAKGSIFGNLVDVQPAGNLESRIRYLCKTCWQLNSEFNPTYY